jgi:hypothetical protein
VVHHFSFCIEKNCRATRLRRAFVSGDSDTPQKIELVATKVIAACGGKPE